MHGVGASELALRRGQGQPVVVLATILQHSPLVLIATGRSGASVHELFGWSESEVLGRDFLTFMIPQSASAPVGRISVGIAVYPEHGDSAEDLLRNGDRALYLAKALGRNQVVAYDPGGQDDARTGAG